MNLVHELMQAFEPGRAGFLFMWVLAGIVVLAFLIIVERWFVLNRLTNVDAQRFVDRIVTLLRNGKFEEAYQLCQSGGKRIVPRVLGSGIRKAQTAPAMVRSTMEEESLHCIPLLEKRIDYILVFGNVSTLIGLMGTIFGLILSFAAVARPDVAAVEKTSLLASGISTAMNTTLLGLMISVPCVLLFSILRSKADAAVRGLDHDALRVLKILLPVDGIQKGYRLSARRIRQETDTEPNIAPMMNLMVILIPLLLTSAEFVKIGAIELKLPSSAQAETKAPDTETRMRETTLNMGVVVSREGFDLYHALKDSAETPPDTGEARRPDIPARDGGYDFALLTRRLAEVKRRALLRILRTAHPGIPGDVPLVKLFTAYRKNDYSSIRTLRDHDDIQIVAEELIPYETIISVMDAARSTNGPGGKVPLFPNVSLAGGIVR